MPAHANAPPIQAAPVAVWRWLLLAPIVAVGFLQFGHAAEAQSVDFTPDFAAPGDSVHFAVGGTCQGEFGEQFVLTWDDPNRDVATVSPTDGNVEGDFVVPVEAEPGTHTLRLTCRAEGGGYNATSSFVVRPREVEPESPASTAPATTRPAPTISSASTTTQSASTTSRPATTTTAAATTTTAAATTTTAAATTTTVVVAGDSTSGRHRSVFPASLTSLDDLSFAPSLVLRNIALAALLMLLIGFPAELFNKTVEKNYEEIATWFSRYRREPRRELPTIITLSLFAAAAAIMYTLLDPDATADRSTLALLIGLFVAVVATTLILELPAMTYIRSRTGEMTHLKVFPKALAFGAVCVAMSRLASFRPGYVYGLIAGYVFVRRRSHPSEAHTGRSVAIGAMSLLAVSAAAWLAWTPLNHKLDKSDEAASLLLLVPDAALAALFVMGLEGLAFGLVPVRPLDGGDLARWNRAAWLALWGAAMFGFVHVLLDPKSGRLDHDSKGAILGMVLLFVAFGAGSITLWAYFRFRRSIPADSVGPPPG